MDFHVVRSRGFPKMTPVPTTCFRSGMKVAQLLAIECQGCFTHQGEGQEIAYPTRCRMVFPDRPGKAHLRVYFMPLAGVISCANAGLDPKEPMGGVPGGKASGQQMV